MSGESGKIGTVELAAYVYISDYRTNYGKEPSGVLFNKYMIMLNRTLLKNGVDMKLSHCWYRWGDEVVSHSIRNHVHFNHDDPYHTVANWISDPVENPERYQLYDGIKSFSDLFIQQFQDKEGVEILLDDVYGEAPFEFQRRYEMVRENLKEALHQVSPMDHRRDVLKPLFDDAMAQFPDDFSSIKDTTNDFRRAFVSAIEMERSTEELYFMSEDFWSFFCNHLRMKCHYHVGKATLDRWKEIIPWEDERFAWIVQDMTCKYLSDSEDTRVRDIIGERDRRMSRVQAMIDSFTDSDLDDLKSFLGRGSC